MPSFASANHFMRSSFCGWPGSDWPGLAGWAVGAVGKAGTVGAASAAWTGRADWSAGADSAAWGGWAARTAAGTVGTVCAAADAEKASSITPASSDRDDRAINPLIICCFTIVYEKSNPEIYAGES